MLNHPNVLAIYDIGTHDDSVSYPGPGRKQMVSIDGGVEPLWGRSANELSYRNGNKMMVAEVKTQSVFSVSQTSG